MKALDDTIAALGRPVFVRALGATSQPKAAIARWRHGAATVNVAPSNAIRLAMSLVEGRNARHRDSRVLADGGADGSVSIFSPSEGAIVEVSGDADVVQLFLDQAYAEAMLDAPFACPSLFDVRDDEMRTAFLRILVGCARGRPDDALRVEEDLHALAVRIERQASQRRPRTQTAPALFRGGLAPAAFRRVSEMMDAALDTPASPTLADMAGATSLSVVHFIRAFRRHTGATPHRYLVRRRMDRAVSQLRIANVPVAEVADKVGFATPAHFVAAFRSLMGVTPGALRDALSG